MTIEKTLSVQKREGSGKGPAGRARTQDMIPGVFYTAKGDNIAVQAPALPLEKMYTEMGRTAVFNLEIDDNGTKTVHPVMFWEVQKHPYKKAFTHVDFYGVDLDKEVKVDVPIEFVGVSRGVKLGGVMETYRESVRLCCKPLDMPKKVTIDVTDMGINDPVAPRKRQGRVRQELRHRERVLQEQGRCRSRRVRCLSLQFFQAGLF